MSSPALHDPTPIVPYPHTAEIGEAAAYWPHGDGGGKARSGAIRADQPRTGPRPSPPQWEHGGVDYGPHHTGAPQWSPRVMPGCGNAVPRLRQALGYPTDTHGPTPFPHSPTPTASGNQRQVPHHHSATSPWHAYGFQRVPLTSQSGGMGSWWRNWAGTGSDTGGVSDSGVHPASNLWSASAPSPAHTAAHTVAHWYPAKPLAEWPEWGMTGVTLGGDGHCT